MRHGMVQAPGLMLTLPTTTVSAGEIKSGPESDVRMASLTSTQRKQVNPDV